ncbi:MAG: NYN domain-containing protein [Candidatus Pacebacteria bacterium]|nr:NYN domain-containing protein [Candidatus Paceibacterota bacterium]
MKFNNKTRVYIDAANLYRGSKSLDWKFDYKNFYIWLFENFKTEEIYFFIGFVEEQKKLYSSLEEIGYKIIFKKTLKSKGKIKGNCDAELVLKAVTDIFREDFSDFVLVSSDGDFACLLEFAKDENKEIKVISPSKKLSYLVRRLPYEITYLNSLRKKLDKKKRPLNGN